MAILPACSPAKQTSLSRSVDPVLLEIMQKDSTFFGSILRHRDDLNVQIIYTEIDRRHNGRPMFTDHYFNVDAANYFYPASTVKLPVAALALQKVHELKVKGLDMYTTMITEAGDSIQTLVYNDPNSVDGRPCIANYVKRILLVSDNNAFNRLYEFLGQEYINDRLRAMGYTDVQIIHRLELSLGEEQNRRTNPIRFVDADGKLIYEQPAAYSRLAYAKRDTKLGKGYMKGNEVVAQPFDFSIKNRLPLQDLHSILRSILFPESMPKARRFKLIRADYDLLHRYMSMYPRESSFPSYDSASYRDTYVKFLLYGSGPEKPDPGIRIFNKVGDAYGFLIDAAYIADFRNKVEFMASAVIYCNSDGILNDDK